ncbi:hypothetical protein I6E17_01020 [Fusobacterium perfoetens]|uniref:hypothetical protein n=1 Tax=Fusobacterium perfoetens TaxID=852 RepID=UPI001F2F985F|nr:hypothetical protein [Fusobacterium perfoetens]MCF2624758.1 hypothetical protein [Fusobacterium perfoetens]
MKDLLFEKFEEIKKSTPELTMFLKNFPKGGDLHNHSLGASFSEFVYEDAIIKNSWYDLRKNIFLNDEEYKFSDKSDKIISIENFKKYYTENMLNSFSMRGWDKTSDGAKHFFNTFFSVLSSKRNENDMILEIIKRNKLQNVKYLELIAEAVPENVKNYYIDLIKNLGEFNLSKMNEYCKILDDADTEENYLKVKEFLDERENFLKSNGEGDFTIKYIPFLARASAPLYKFFAEAYCFMVYCIKEKRIAGVNIVEPEDAIPSRENFENHLKILKFIYKYLSEKYISSQKKINLTLHAGELNLLRSPLEDMNDRICSTIFLTRNKNEQKFPAAKRIGHGVSIPWEENCKALLNFMNTNKIAVEICLSSNDIILGIKEKNHPFSLYKKYNVPMIICTDDEAVSRSNITLEYVKAVEAFNLNYNDLKNLSRNGIEYSFLEGESLYIDGNYDSIRSEFKDINSIEEWKEKFIEYKDFILSNEKLKKQIELEISFIIFEQEYI